jgi:hypothetical protein
MLLKSVAAGVLALGLLGSAALSVPASDTSPSAVVETSTIESTELAANTCCAKRAYCCTIKRSCCGSSAAVQNDDQ